MGILLPKLAFAFRGSFWLRMWYTLHALDTSAVLCGPSGFYLI